MIRTRQLATGEYTIADGTANIYEVPPGTRARITSIRFTSLAAANDDPQLLLASFTEGNSWRKSYHLPVGGGADDTVPMNLEAGDILYLSGNIAGSDIVYVISGSTYVD